MSGRSQGSPSTRWTEVGLGSSYWSDWTEVLQSIWVQVSQDTCRHTHTHTAQSASGRGVFCQFPWCLCVCFSSSSDREREASS